MYVHAHTRLRNIAPCACAHTACSGTSCVARVAVPALAIHTNRSRNVQRNSWELAPHVHSTYTTRQSG